VKYLGLQLLRDVLVEDKSMIHGFKDYIVRNFHSEDTSIKMRALDIIKVTVISSFAIIDNQREPMWAC